MNTGTVAKQTQIDEQSESLQKLTDQLMETIDLLEQRLERFLLPSMPRDEKKAVEANLVPFADFLRVRCWAIQGIRDRVTSILERLEV